MRELMADEQSTTGTLVDLDPGKGTQEQVATESGSTETPTEGTGAEKVVAGPWINNDGSFAPDWTTRLPEDVRDEAIQMKLGNRF